jgi:hypothetical protein
VVLKRVTHSENNLHLQSVGFSGDGSKYVVVWDDAVSIYDAYTDALLHHTPFVGGMSNATQLICCTPADEILVEHADYHYDHHLVNTLLTFNWKGELLGSYPDISGRNSIPVYQDGCLHILEERGIGTTRTWR